MDHNLIFYQQDHCAFSWPRRNFRCNFCNKEYKSAQALGGHMNVHRKDRARLGLSSPPSRHANPNPNPNHISPPSPPRYLPYNTYHSSLFPLASSTKDEQLKEEGGGGNGGTRVWKKYEIFNMEMEIGSLKDGSIELDLELRLGRS